MEQIELEIWSLRFGDLKNSEVLCAKKSREIQKDTNIPEMCLAWFGYDHRIRRKWTGLLGMSFFLKVLKQIFHLVFRSVEKKNEMTTISPVYKPKKILR